MYCGIKWHALWVCLFVSALSFNVVTGLARLLARLLLSALLILPQSFMSCCRRIHLSIGAKKKKKDGKQRERREEEEEEEKGDWTVNMPSAHPAQRSSYCILNSTRVVYML
jgi:hypothetical protein